MPNMKAIKRRRLTVKNISQITKAMNLVATSKLQKARRVKEQVGKIAYATFEITYSIAKQPEVAEHPLLQQHNNTKKSAYIVITGDRGLCGGYNSNVCKEFIAHIEKQGKEPLVITIGTKGRDYLRRRNFEITDATEDLSDYIADLYTAGEVDEVYIVYTKFVTVLNLEPIVRKILPIDPAYLRKCLADNLRPKEKWEDLGFFTRPGERENTNAFMEFEPDLATVLESAMPLYLNMFIQAATSSAELCEHAARMTSMDSSTKNASDIIEKLTLQFNRQRQSIITQEITEIVSGANALQ